MPIAASSQYFFLNLHLLWATFSGTDCERRILYNNILENFISHFCRYPVFLALGAPGLFRRSELATSDWIIIASAIASPILFPLTSPPSYLKHLIYRGCFIGSRLLVRQALLNSKALGHLLTRRSFLVGGSPVYFGCFSLIVNSFAVLHSITLVLGFPLNHLGQLFTGTHPSPQGLPQYPFPRVLATHR